MFKRRSRSDYVFVAIHLSKIREVFAIDYIGGSACYWVLHRALLPEPVSFIGSMAGPVAIRLSLELLRNTRRKRIPERRRLIAPPAPQHARADAAIGRRSP